VHTKFERQKPKERGHFEGTCGDRRITEHIKFTVMAEDRFRWWAIVNEVVRIGFP
jgi:hypothetical protein